MDGNGIITTGLSKGTHFSYDGNGFAQLTGWVDPGDGLLGMDRDGDGIIDDGTELFGNRTPFKDGTRATNGFQALAELDDNGDGRIDADDRLVGLGADDTLHGDEGNDRLYGSEGLYCGAPVFGMCPGSAATSAY